MSLADAIRAQATRLGVSPVDIATVMSYETGGTFDPWKAGPTTQWGQHRGLIQMGEPQRAKYGVTADMPPEKQVEAAGNYLLDAGVKPGMGLLDIYSAVNAGHVGRYNASDANNGGAPGTVADKVAGMDAHRANALGLLGENPPPQEAGTPAPALPPPVNVPTLPVVAAGPEAPAPAAPPAQAAPAVPPAADPGKGLGQMGGGLLAAAQPKQDQGLANLWALAMAQHAPQIDPPRPYQPLSGLLG